jgi:hypothetical protein
MIRILRELQPNCLGHSVDALDIRPVGKNSTGVDRQVRGKAETTVVLPRSCAIPYRALLPGEGRRIGPALRHDVLAGDRSHFKR